VKMGGYFRGVKCNFPLNILFTPKSLNCDRYVSRFPSGSMSIDFTARGLTLFSILSNFSPITF
jgi:hypothetical protein